MILNLCLGDKKRSTHQQEQQKWSQRLFRVSAEPQAGTSSLVRLTRGVQRTRGSTEIWAVATQSYQSTKPRDIPCVVQQNHIIKQLSAFGLM